MQRSQQQYDNGSPYRGGEGNNDQEQYPNEGGSPGDQEYEGEEGDQYQEGEGGDTVTKKLVGSRVARKRAEEDVKLLANRIALLKMEEQKAWKKIEETKKKAKDIMLVKNRNTEQQKIKDQRKRDKELEEKMLAEKNLNMKQNIKENIQMSKEQYQKKLIDEAERLKIEKREQQELMMMQKEQDQLKNASIKQMVKNQQQEAEEKKRLEQAEKKAKQRAELQQKIIAENQRRLAIEADVSRLEQEEIELIKKLQNTQFIQKAAYEDLENALNGSLSPEQMKQSQSSGGNVSQNRDYSPVKSIGSSDQKGGRPQTSGNKYTPQHQGK